MAKEHKTVALAAYKPFLHILSIHDMEKFQNQDRRNLTRNIGHFIIVLILFIGTIVGMLCDAWYCFISNRFQVGEMALPFGLLINFLQLTITFASIAIRNGLIKDVIASLEEIISNRCEFIFERVECYKRWEERFSLFTSIATKIAACNTIVFFGFEFLIPISYAIFGYPEPTPLYEFYVPLPGVTNTLVQYYIDWSIRLLFTVSYYTMILTIALFFFGMCIYIGGMVEDLQITLADLGSDSKMMANQLYAQIAFHNQLLDIARAVGRIMSTGLFFQLLVHAISLAVYMLGIESNDVHSTSFFISMICVFVTTSSTYVYCYLSEYVTYKLSVVGDHFYNCAWYRLPIKQQQMFILPIQRSHLEFRMTGLGIVECSLRVFSSIMRAACSYFLLMKSSIRGK